MISKVLDAQIVLKGKTLPITNTEYDIFVEWAIAAEEKDESVELRMLFYRVYGKFQYKEVNDSYRKRVEVDFESNKDWVLSVEKMEVVNNRVYPELVVIELDNKKAKITLQQC